MHNHAKMVWGCAVVIVVAVILGMAGVVGAAVLAIPCILMMGMMVWMMVRGMGHAPHRHR